MTDSLFDYLEADESHKRKEQRTALRVANKRVKDRFGSFLSVAENFEDHKSRLDLVSDDIQETIQQVVSEYGGDPTSIEASILRSLSGVHKLAPGDDHLPAASDKRNRQYEHIKEDCEKRGKSEDECKELAARTVNKQRAENGETKSHTASVHESRRPKLCPYHSEVVDISLATGDPRAGFDSMAQHAWGGNHCQGEGFEGRCNFKRDMVTQSYWDDKKQQADERRQQRELERERLLEEAPHAPEGEIGDVPEPELVDEPKEINEELAEAPSAVETPEPMGSEMAPAMARAQSMMAAKQAEAPRDGGGAVKTVEVDQGSADDPSPEMNKTRWTPENVKLEDTEMDGSPHPTKEKDILEPIKTDRADNFLDETDSVTEKQELPSANDDGYSTDKNTETIHTDTWGGNNGASPVTRETQSKVAVGEDPMGDPANSDPEAFAQEPQLEPGSTVIVTPKLGPGEGYMRDTEAGAQPWEAHFVGYSADGKAVIDTGPGEYGGLREMDPARLKPKKVFNDHEPTDTRMGEGGPGRGPQPEPPLPGYQSSVDPDKNPIREILEDGFVPQSQVDDAISQYEQ
jgi:hypothetical protein